MRFFDCNAFFGLPAIRPLMPVPTAEMDRAGIEPGVGWWNARTVR
jgi:hypothetical protein